MNEFIISHFHCVRFVSASDSFSGSPVSNNNYRIVIPADIFDPTTTGIYVYLYGFYVLLLFFYGFKCSHTNIRRFSVIIGLYISLLFPGHTIVANKYSRIMTTTKQRVHSTSTVHSNTETIVQYNEDSQDAKDNWVVVVRQLSGAVNFTCPWKDYVAPIWIPRRRYMEWVGKTVKHSKKYMLRVDVEDWNRSKYFSEYSHFYMCVGSAATGYKLMVVGYNKKSSGGDSLSVYRGWRSVHNGRKFSTFDNDNDRWHTEN